MSKLFEEVIQESCLREMSEEEWRNVMKSTKPAASTKLDPQNILMQE